MFEKKGDEDGSNSPCGTGVFFFGAWAGGKEPIMTPRTTHKKTATHSNGKKKANETKTIQHNAMPKAFGSGIQRTDETNRAGRTERDVRG